MKKDSYWTCMLTGLMLLRAAKERRGETAMRAMADIFKLCKYKHKYTIFKFYKYKHKYTDTQIGLWITLDWFQCRYY